MTQLILFNLLNGLIIGAFYALMALGLSLILNLSGVINFAHGGFPAIGGFIAYQLIIGLVVPEFHIHAPQFLHLPIAINTPSFTLLPPIGFWGALILAPFVTAALGVLVERVLLR